MDLLHSYQLQISAVVKGQINKGADLEAGKQYGHTALMWAIFQGYGKIVKLLLERGADPTAFERPHGNTLVFFWL